MVNSFRWQAGGRAGSGGGDDPVLAGALREVHGLVGAVDDVARVFALGDGGDAGAEREQQFLRVGEEEAKRIVSKAASRGTRIHTICEHYIANNYDPTQYSIIDRDTFDPLRKIIDEHIDNIHMQEVRLYSDYLEMAGTVDCIAEFAGRLSIIDFKTARKAKNREYIQNYFCQATAYAIMYEELTGIPVPNIVILISVDDDYPQIFTDKRDYHVKPLLEIRKKYKEIYNV